MKSTSQTIIDIPTSRIDLLKWMATMSDSDYQACSRRHRAAGTFREGSSLGMVNVESIGGNLLVQHYQMVKGEASQVVMHSKKSRAYILHLFPATVEVIWTVEIELQNSDSTIFRCTVETRLPTFLQVVASPALLSFFIRRHTIEETLGFAADIERKARQGLL